MLDEEAMKHYRGEAWEMSSEKSDSHEALESVITQKHNSKSWKKLMIVLFKGFCFTLFSI